MNAKSLSSTWSVQWQRLGGAEHHLRNGDEGHGIHLLSAAMIAGRIVI